MAFAVSFCIPAIALTILLGNSSEHYSGSPTWASFLVSSTFFLHSTYTLWVSLNMWPKTKLHENYGGDVETYRRTKFVGHANPNKSLNVQD